MGKKSIQWGECVIPLIALLFAISYFVQTRDAPMVALYWPIIIAAVTGALWVALIVKFVVAESREGEDRERPPMGFSDLAAHSQRPAMVLLFSVAYLAAVPRLGFSLSNFLFLLVLFRALGSRRWLKNVAVALCIAGFLHVALIFFMKLSVPQLHLGPVSL